MELSELLFLKKATEQTPNQASNTPTPPSRIDVLSELWQDFQEAKNKHLTKQELYQLQVRSQIGKTILLGMPQQIEATSTHTERHIILQMWKPIPNEQI